MYKRQEASLGRLRQSVAERIDRAEYGCRSFAELQRRLAEMAPAEFAARPMPAPAATTDRAARVQLLAARARQGIELFAAADTVPPALPRRLSAPCGGGKRKRKPRRPPPPAPKPPPPADGSRRVRSWFPPFVRGRLKATPFRRPAAR